MSEIKIDAKTFQERAGDFISAWKADTKRSGDDGVFAGVGSILVMMGKVEEVPEYQKNNAFHVSLHRTSSCIKSARFLTSAHSSGFLATSSRQR